MVQRGQGGDVSILANVSFILVNRAKNVNENGAT
jgi:hypothetical protein